ncbi:hypothetical protein [Nonomuraea insulae]|uniref:Phage integrase family protein with SAM-like domain n=1 Tax=Nonomuraea insulae TaxID=1616787 RepID=A0ABW1CWI4_9ACTN
MSINGCPNPDSWPIYAQALRDWVMFLAEHGVEVFDTRTRLKMALGVYAAHRGFGPVRARFKASTWNQHVSILATFYRWAVDEEYAAAQSSTAGTRALVFRTHGQCRARHDELQNRASRRTQPGKICPNPDIAADASPPPHKDAPG